MIWWGVRKMPGVVVRCYDLPSALSEERLLRERGWEAQMVVSRDLESWRLVPWSATVRPDPVPPRGPRRVAVGDGLGRGDGWWVRLVARTGRYRQPFRRSGV